MSPQEFERKLSAILSADVVEYSRLMGDDEDFTIRTLTGNREMIATLIKQYKGRVVDSPGDNLLSEFSSVTQAVNCAVEIQRELAERNAEFPENQRMVYRIGVNLGDVAQEGDRIYGDGVNIAARLESLAEPGGICISGFVYNQVKNRLKLEYKFMGEQTVKNIKEPVPVYRVLSFLGAAAHKEIKAKKAAEKGRMAAPFSEKPSIAVLPFVNISGDQEQEYFSDGMTEELISALAKLEGLKVISRTSVFYFKGKDVDLRTIGEKLKVDNVLEGSVRKAGNKLRISAQLIKVVDDTHLWSENYNRELIDVFDVQEEISQAIIKNLKVKLLGMETERLVKDYSKNTKAYELFLKGNFYFNKGIIGYEKAIEYYEKAVKADSDYAPAYAHLAQVYTVMAITRSLPPWDTKPKINALLQKALEIDDKYACTYVFLGMIKMVEYDWQRAEINFKQALELNPGHSDSHNGYSNYLAAIGHMNEAIVEAKRAVEFDPLSSWYLFFLGRKLTYSQQFDQAINLLLKALELDSNNNLVLSVLAEAYAGKGMYDKAISMIQGFRNIPSSEARLGYLYGKAGKRDVALKILEEFLEQSKRGYISPYYIAYVYAGLGDKDKVFEWLDKAYDLRDLVQWLIKVDSIFDDLHSDPRWTEQMKKRGLAD
jgi:TolB-like protein/cytochrome c-type biogenesis protein CcmH/NrfG